MDYDDNRIYDPAVKYDGYDSKTKQHKIVTMSNPTFVEILVDGYLPMLYKYKGAVDEEGVVDFEHCQDAITMQKGSVANGINISTQHFLNLNDEKAIIVRNGILFDKNNTLISYPNGRIDEGSDEIIIPGVIEEIKPGAVYKVSGLSKVFFDTDDYATVADLNGNGFVSANGNLLDVYICDATYGSVLFNEYLDDESWEDYADADKLHCYYPLKIGSAKAATMYIGFDTQLPIGLKAYTVVSDSKEESLAYLKKMSNKIPNRSPIVIFADEPGTYRLFPLDEQLEPWNMYENKLNGVGRDGMEVYQSDADRGSILTLGRNSSGALAFFYYKGTTSIPPYRAYLTYEWVTNAKQYLLFKFLDDETTGIESPTPTPARGGEGSLYDLQGRKISEEPISLKKGIYIYKGKKIIVK